MQSHPVLSAMVEVAFRARKRTIWYGDWSGLDSVAVDPDAQDGVEWKCPHCGSAHYRQNYVDARRRPLNLPDSEGYHRRRGKAPK
jgi:hypothetical protein